MKPFETVFRVRSYEMDSLGHVNHAVYLNYFEQARYNALEEGGFPHTEMTSRNWGVYVIRVEVDYRKPCIHGQMIRIRTWIEEFRGSSMTIAHELRREDDGPDADPAVTARVVAVWIGANGRPMRIPEEARKALSP